MCVPNVLGKGQWDSNPRWYKCKFVTTEEHKSSATYTSIMRGGPYLGTDKMDDSCDEGMAVAGARKSRRTPPMASTGLYFDKHDSFDLESLDAGESDAASEICDDADDSADDSSVEELRRPRKILRVTSFGNNTDVPSATVKRNRGRRHRDRRACRQRLDEARKKKIIEQQQQITKLRDLLNTEKEQSASLSTILNDTCADAAAAIEAERDKNKAVSNGTIFQRLRGYLPGRGRMKKIANQLFASKYLKSLLILLTVRHVRGEVYTKTKLAEATDRVPGFSLRCVEGFRSIQNGKKGVQKMVWSSGSIKKIHRSIEKEMQAIIPMTVINEMHDGSSVDGISFDEEAVFQFIVEKFGLSKKAKHGTVEIALTIDGAKLEGKLCHVTIGFKLVDVDSVDPNTGNKVFKNMQSDAWCFPLITIVAKDNKSTYSKYFNHIFDFCNRLRAEGLFLEDGTKWRPFLIPEPQDMKSHQICLGRGGAAKGPGVVHFDHLCMCTSDEIALPNQVLCDECKKARHYICLHHKVLDAEEVRRSKEELLGMDQNPLVCQIVRVCKDTVPARVWDDPKQSAWEHLYNEMPLHLVAVGISPGLYDPMDDARRYNRLVNDCLARLDMATTHGILLPNERKELVGKMLFFICRLKHCHNAVKFENCLNVSKSRVEDAVPCILHMHKRIIEKVMTLIFIIALDEASSTNKSTRAKKVADMEHHINTIAFGTEDKPGRYCIPYDKQKSEILDVSFNDEWAQRLEKKFEVLIPLMLKKPSSRSDSWLVLTGDLVHILNVLKRKDDFTDREISILQDDIDLWAENWVAMNGKEGCTNYTHLLTCHATYFLRRWRNLYRYSNQGWEYQNKRIRNRYHHHTTRGGSTGTKGGRSSKIKPIGLWFLRIMYWMAIDKTKDTRRTIDDKIYESEVEDSDDDASFMEEPESDVSSASEVSEAESFYSFGSNELSNLGMLEGEVSDSTVSGSDEGEESGEDSDGT
jgi:hypothetical protein